MLALGSHLRPPRLSGLRLRGGEDASDNQSAVPEVPPAAAITKEQILEKLNGVPTFAIVNKDGGIVGMQDAEGGKKSVCWFTDGDEAKAILKAMMASNPDAGLKLACHGLGGAFTQCNGWPAEEDGDNPKKATAQSTSGEEIELRLQGNHALCKETGPRLKALLEENGFDAGCWQLPVFVCEKLASTTIMPVFLNPRDLAIVWEKSGRKMEDLPQDITVVDLRMLVSQMGTDTNPWSIFAFVASPSAIKLATQIQDGAEYLEDADDGQAEGAAAAGADDAVDADTNAAEEEEEVLV